MNATVRRCLVIDDDADFRAALSAALGRRGYAVMAAADGAAALACAAAEMPDDAVLDLRLGDESGLALIAPLLARNPAMRIVVLTGYASIATAVEAIKLGAVHYLTKPADAAEVAAAFGAGAGDPDVDLAARPTPLDQLTWEHIQRSLVACDGNISAAAKRLGLHRRTLQRKLQKRPSGL
jgi:two-component system response regulator RegA